MNKKNMGSFLKKLRNSHGLTMNQLIEKLDSENLTVTTKTIVDWEKGNTVPELEKLVFLANLYGVSVDEILDGERFITKEDLLKKYPLFAEDFFKNNNEDFFEKRTKYVRKVNERFKGLIKQFYDAGLNNNEKTELDFLFKHKCKLSEYCPESSNDEFLSFFNELKGLKTDGKIGSFDEFWWEAQKLFDNEGSFTKSISFSAILEEEMLNEENHFVKLLLEQAEPWEMDMLVAGLQNFDPVTPNIEGHSNFLIEYKRRHGKEFNREAIFKSTLKFLLTHGAKLNPLFYSINVRKHKKIRVIDRLEELYKLCTRPIEIYTIDDEKMGFMKRQFIENTKFNRFLDEYYSFLFIIATQPEAPGLKPKDLYDLVLGDENDERVVRLLCKHRNIDTDREQSYVLADANSYLSQWRQKKKEFLEREKKIEEGFEEIKRLESLLSEKVEFFEEPYTREVGPKDSVELPVFVKYVKSSIPLSQFYEERDDELTRQLLAEIDQLTVQEIREKYFFKETIDGGEDND